MKKKRFIFICAIIGFVAGLLACFIFNKIRAFNESSSKSEVNWLICTRVNMDIISDALAKYIQTNSATNKIELKALVQAGLLPEWSEIYACPSEFNGLVLRSNYDDAFRVNVFSKSIVAVYYTNSSYYVEELSNAFRIRCRFHTNELNYVVDKKAKN